MSAKSTHTWKSIGQAGNASAVGLVATGPIAILAGFSLAALVNNLNPGDNSDRTVLLDVSALFFAAAVLLLLSALRLLITAQHWVASPSELLDLYPEATIDVRMLQTVRNMQSRHVLLYDANRTRAGTFSSLGIASALAALSCWTFDASGGRPVLMATGAVLASGVVLTALELVGRPRTVFPDEMGWAEKIERKRSRDRRAGAKPGDPEARRQRHERLERILGARPVNARTAQLFLRTDDPHLSGERNVPTLVRLAREQGKAALLLSILDAHLEGVPHIAVEPWCVRLLHDHQKPHQDATTLSIPPMSLSEPSIFVIHHGRDDSLSTSFLSSPDGVELPTAGTACVLCTATKRILVEQLRKAMSPRTVE